MEGSSKTVFVNRPVIQKVFVEKPADSAPERIQTAKDTGRAETHYQKGLVYYSLRNYREAFNEWKVATPVSTPTRGRYPRPSSASHPGTPRVKSK